MTSINGKRRRIGDDVVYFFIYLCAALSVVLLAGIIIYVFVRGIGQVNWQFLTSETSVLRGTVGIAGNLLNTLYIIIITMLIATPVGVGAAGWNRRYRFWKSKQPWYRAALRRRHLWRKEVYLCNR